MMNQLLDMDYNLRYMTERYLTNKKRKKKKKEISKRTSHPLSGLNHRPVYRSQPHQREKTSRKHHPGRLKKTSKKYCNTITWCLPFRHVESDRGQRDGGKQNNKQTQKSWNMTQRNVVSQSQKLCLSLTVGRAGAGAGDLSPGKELKTPRGVSEDINSMYVSEEHVKEKCKRKT